LSRLLLVSNRLPVTVRVDRGQVRVDPSDGGLASGLRGIHTSADTLWIGWPGDASRFSDAQRAELTRDFDERRLRAVPLSPNEVAWYYDGFSNGVLWPLFHYLLDRVPLEPAHWDAYVRVNQRFADVVAEEARPGDRVWVHDYHLCLVPALLRRRMPDLRIGFFLHIPFPSAEVYRTLVARRALLEGLLGADVLGFHTDAYRVHFANAAALLLGARTDGDLLRSGGRAVRLVTTPMGVDAAGIAAIAEEPAVLADTATRREDGVRLLLGVDRLDYTKGLTRRLLAFERLLEREPRWRGRVRLLQVAVPSRERVDAYRDIRRQVEEHVGRINGLYTQGTAVPIHYVYRSLDERQVIALYRAADVMVVTPLRDGMNLVAKEFVAARTDLDGVLVLSELAGAAAGLGAALVVNPFDIGRVATTLARALDMPDAERHARMRMLRAQVDATDVNAWASRFLGALDSTAAAPGLPAPSAPADVDAMIRSVRAAARRVLLLDYDGTLVPFFARPPMAAPDPALLALLRRLAAEPGTDVHLMSGRLRTDLQRWFGDLPIGLHAEHGLWSRWPLRSRWEMRPLPFIDWKATVRGHLAAWVERTPGTHVEEKTAALAFHYRESGLEDAPEDLRLEAEEFTRWLPIDVLYGNRVLELRARGVHKGAVVAAMRDRGELEGAILAMGDDRTDADLFAALPPDAFTIQVGAHPLPARYRVAGPAEARALLERLDARAIVEA
jgi:trehalose 6-phosphate synthase/phosphatase